MKKYRITFTNNKTKLDLVNKWEGKEITLIELESLIPDFEEVVFDGKTIEIYNDYRE